MATLSSEDVISIIALGTVGMLILIGGIALFILVYQKKVLHEKQKQALLEMEYQNNMITMQLQSQEQERKRIGADLHDSLGSLLWGAKINAAFIQRTVDLQGEAKASHNELIQILDKSLTTVRRIAWELTPEAFHHAGFSQSIADLCNQLNGKGLDAKFVETGSHYWNDHDALQAYRIVQELVSNVLKHAKATMVTVSIYWRETTLEINVQDDGIGFKLGDKRAGVGWWSIEQRAKHLKAEIRIGDSTTSQGTTVTLNIPLNHDKGKN
jgi:two-component system, NarL family, sensor kinase